MDPSLLTIQKLLPMLGRELDELKADPAISQIFRHYREPEIDRAAEQWTAWVTMKRFGLELGFIDKRYREAAPQGTWGLKPLVLHQVYFYPEDRATGGRTFQGALPMGITFNDNRADVRRKMAAWEHRRRSYVSDCWVLDEYTLVVAYTEGDAAVACVFCSIEDAPWPTRPTDVALPPFREILGCLGAASTSEKLREVWSFADVPRLLHAVTSRSDTVDLRHRHGVELRFAPASEIDTAAKSNEMRLLSVHLFRERMHNAVAWVGELPFELAWDDSPEALFRKVGVPPLDRSDGAYAGTAAWELPEFGLLVTYSTTHNVLTRIIVQIPGRLPAALEP
ncbi:MAG: hypothetical protein IPK82_07390 [Polyangiaceae bacterium]|nr:hypothetical protein [Polyangiaceae bacterium]